MELTYCSSWPKRCRFRFKTNEIFQSTALRILRPILQTELLRGGYTTSSIALMVQSKALNPNKDTTK